MSVGINANSIYASIRDRAQNQADSWAGLVRSKSPSSPSQVNQNSSTRAMEYQQRQADKAKRSIADQSVSYADALRASRTKAKETALEKKKLQYNSNKISSQIVRSKNSVTAKKAASSARRELMRLKRLRSTGEYDEEELQISIEHAKAMERIAKKKVAHLQQEEMIERSHNGAFAAFEEKEAEIRESSEEELKEEELTEEELSEEELSEEELARIMSEEMDLSSITEEYAAEIMENMEENIAETMEDSMSELMDELASEMAEMMEELDLSELMDTMAAPNPNMSEEDLKKLKIKHRTKEMKDIAQANGDYLKAIFEKYKKSGIVGASPGGHGALPTGAPSPESILHHTKTPVTVTLAQPYNSSGAGMTFNAMV